MGIPFKLYEGKEVNLPAELTAGGIYFCEDSGNVFIDVDIDGTLTRVPLGKKYVDDQLIDIREFIENQGSGIEIGDEPPTKESANVWIDTDDGDDEGVEYLGVVTSINGKGGDVNITASDIDAAEKTHASQHASGGSDPITPAAIGAVSGFNRSILAGEDLNDFIVDASYYCTGVNAPSVVNAPFERAFHLYVRRGDNNDAVARTIQIAVITSATTTGIKYRNHTDTGWSEWKEFATTDSVYLLTDATPIPENADANTYLTPGSYICQTTAIAGTLVNFPHTTTGFKLTVERIAGTSGTYLIQEVKANHKDALIYRRRIANESFSEWKQVATTDYALNKAGDTMTGDLNITNSETSTKLTEYVSSGGTAYVGTLIDGIYKYISWLSSQAGTDSLYWSSNATGVHHEYQFLHTGNKPFGEYTGNASSQAVDIGGIGNSLVFLQGQNNWIGFAAFYGTIMFHTGSGEVRHFTPAECQFNRSTGLLTINTTDNAVNESQVVFYYTRL